MRSPLLAVGVTGFALACSTNPAPATFDAASPDMQPSRDTSTSEVLTSDLGDVTTRDTVTDTPSVATDTPEAASSDSLESRVSRSTFEQLFPHRGTSPCRGAFYTYEAFLRAARDFPNFSGEGPEEVRRRELAAFLANIAHETTGGWATAPDGQFSWGLCWVEEGGAVPPTADYCSSSTEFPCAAGQRYYGRGPIQLSWNYNYGQAGRALTLPLLTDPGLAARDPVVAFRTAFWFWMTPQAPKPSCHEVMVGNYTPSVADRAEGRLPGFGLTVNIINGGLECGRSAPPAVQDRLGYYHRFTGLLGVSPGPNLDCASMRPYG